MIDFDDLTLIVCSYNTPDILETMLKSFVFHHKTKNPMSIIVMENSTNELTVRMLQKNKIPYVRNKGMTHSIAVDIALKNVKTKYALLVDSDIIFNRSVEEVYKQFVSNGVCILGEVGGDRGGYRLYPRVYPWFCMIDMEQINKHNITFHDQKRIDSTNSGKFFGNIPLNFDHNGHYYDVGSTFLEDIHKNNLKIANVKLDDVFFTHLEGMSWHKETNIGWFLDVYKNKEPKIFMNMMKYKSASINRKFV